MSEFVTKVRFRIPVFELKRAVFCASLLALVLAACGSSVDDGSTASSGKIELSSWWTSGGEADALNAALAVHKAKYPNVTVVNLADSTATKARQQLELKVLENNLPDTFQTNIGADLLRWVKFNGIDTSESKIEPIQATVSSSGFYDSLVAKASLDGNFYAVPMNIHRINSLFYSKKVFDDHKIGYPTDDMTLDEFNSLCMQIKAAKVTPLALGNHEPWVLQELVFEDILPGIAGAAYYEAFWQGLKSPGDSVIDQTIQEALWLRCGPAKASSCNDGFFNGDADTMEWTDALDLVQSNQVAMVAMGDWAKGYFESNGWQADVNFGVVQFPGTKKVFIYTADTFSLTAKSGPSHTLAAQLLQTFASVESQGIFNHFKGSIPALDVDLSQYPDPGLFDSMQQQTFLTWKNAEQGLAMSGLLLSDALTELGVTLMNATVADPKVSIQTYLDKNYPTLRKL